MNAVIVSPQTAWSAAEWSSETARAERVLVQLGGRVVATVMDNTPGFVAIDEAALSLGRVHVPLPGFFSPQQIHHALEAVGADTLIVSPQLAAGWYHMAWERLEMAGEPLCATRTGMLPKPLQSGTTKVTFTSGTTGNPKGVCLSTAGMETVVQSLVEAMAPLGIARHLSALPYAVLLENLAGVMAARRQGATVISLPLADVGLQGSSGFDAARLDAAVRQWAPESLILLPQMLKAWCGHLRHSGLRAHPSLKLVAVGGAPVGAQWLAQARQLGIPAYEGYGLSEGASVQTLNLPWAHRDGSAGRVLPHRDVRIADDGEIEVSGSLFLGHLGEPAHTEPWWPTGDLGQLDGDGYLWIQGRKKNVLITGFGRNVCPEWVETALQQSSAIALAVVMGDGQARLSAVIWPLPNQAEPRLAIQAAVDRANATLPDYAQVTHWVLADPGERGALFTPNGRPLRSHIAAIYQPLLREVANDPLALSID
jgi:long-chain acyl-CoA synthetase